MGKQSLLLYLHVHAKANKMIFCCKIESYHMTTKNLFVKEHKNFHQIEKPWIKFQHLSWNDDFLRFQKGNCCNTQGLDSEHTDINNKYKDTGVPPLS